jgi:murein L,D-transpeptidase YafK
MLRLIKLQTMRFRNIFLAVLRTLCLTVALLLQAQFTACSSPKADFVMPTAEIHLEAGKIDKSKTRIVIEKFECLLYLYEKDSLLKRYPVVFGTDPISDKMMQGDGCTPEGTFHIRDQYDHAKWTKFIWIDYPNEESWKRFNARKAAGTIPSDAEIGGDIGIHGVPQGADHAIKERDHWTLGCISMTNANIAELYGLVQVGTEVIIHH